MPPIQGFAVGGSALHPEAYLGWKGKGEQTVRWEWPHGAVPAGQAAVPVCSKSVPQLHHLMLL